MPISGCVRYPGYALAGIDVVHGAPRHRLRETSPKREGSPSRLGVLDEESKADPEDAARGSKQGEVLFRRGKERSWRVCACDDAA
eukprot:669194-Rhodomonas_salina.5